MNQQHIHKGIFFSIAIALIVMGAGCNSSTSVGTNYTPNSSSETNNTSPASTQGHVVFSLTDAAGNMNGVTSVQLTVDKIEMNSTASGWITVSNDTKEYDLLALKASSALALATQANVPAGVYNQIRLHVSKILVVKSGVKAEAKLPSNKLEISGQFIVNNDSTTSIKLDFLADESMHITGNGKFIFAPVIKTESRTNADVSVANDDTVVVVGGDVESDTTAGMDVDGMMRDNFKLEAGEKLEINDNDTIKLMDTSSVKVKTDDGVKVKVKVNL